MKTKTVCMQRMLREVLSLSFIVIGALAARSTLADHYYVPSGSIEYTLMSGDRVFVNKHAFGLRVPFTNIKLTDGEAVQRGDVVIFDSPRDGTRLIKRIVAIGGDQVRIHNGRLAINGEWLASSEGVDEEIIGNKRVRMNLTDGGGPALLTTIDDGMVLAIGDHRGNSADSRVFGAVSQHDIYGRAVAIYYRRGDGLGWSEL